MDMDNATAHTMSVPLYSNAARDAQNDRHTGHRSTFPDTSAIASPKPRLTISVAETIMANAIHTMSITYATVNVTKLSLTNCLPQDWQLDVAIALTVLPFAMVTLVGAVADVTGMENTVFRGCDIAPLQPQPHFT